MRPASWPLLEAASPLPGSAAAPLAADVDASACMSYTRTYSERVATTRVRQSGLTAKAVTVSPSCAGRERSLWYRAPRGLPAGQAAAATPPHGAADTGNTEHNSRAGPARPHRLSGADDGACGEVQHLHARAARLTPSQHQGAIVLVAEGGSHAVQPSWGSWKGGVGAAHLDLCRALARQELAVPRDARPPAGIKGLQAASRAVVCLQLKGHRGGRHSCGAAGASRRPTTKPYASLPPVAALRPGRWPCRALLVRVQGLIASAAPSA
jgi:hypothetical protein